MLTRAEEIYHGQSLFKYPHAKNRAKTNCPCQVCAGYEIKGAGVYPQVEGLMLPCQTGNRPPV